MSLFQWGNFKLHSGEESWWRIDCDALTDSEIEIFAKIISEDLKDDFGSVTCPKSHPGSIVYRLVNALNKYSNPRETKSLLIVDDVLTTGNSMWEEWNKHRQHWSRIQGAVLFARGECPDWVISIFKLSI